MALILNLETATKVCSVSLAENGFELATREICTEHFSHAENLNVFIESVMQQAGKKLAALDAIAVSEGPGSYTGLRIGTSTAKGLCYALDKPLVAVNSLKALAALVTTDADYICPMFDAMRMEVYSALFDKSLHELHKTEALIIDEHAYVNYLNEKKIVFVGPGAAKCASIIQHPNALFDVETAVSARGMIALSEAKYKTGSFEDVAYFEPFYLKDFIAGEKKSLL
jgi:tRNA threonylcarbamoyladenosine biosynthesis protein TsaB